MNSRLQAARIIDAVTNGVSLTESIEIQLAHVKDPRDRAFIQAICYGVCRFYPRLDVALSYLLKKPMKEKDSLVHALLIVGLYQLMYMRVKEHAAVKETVDATQKLKQTWSRGLVNAILREYIRERDKIEQALMQDAEGEFAHPAWMINKIKEDWPDHAAFILAANNEHPPFTLRVNQQKISRDNFLQLLNQQEIVAQPFSETESGIIVETKIPTENLPGFHEGYFSVQDGAAQFAATLLDLQPNLRVLDACAAPGGKLTHLLEQEKALSCCVAVEKEEMRFATISDNLKRLQLNATCILADVTKVKTWWDGKPFDRILVDAPCSASGVIRRHPDIKLLRQPADIAALQKTQLAMLTSLWPLLASGGILLYATCSIFFDENEKVITQFLANTPDAAIVQITKNAGIALQHGHQILPGMMQMDGFYYAKLTKQPV